MIHHKENLGFYLEYSYIYYDHNTDHLQKIYKEFGEELKKLGYVFGDEPYNPTGGILLETNSEVIAGTIWTDLAYPTAIKILTTVIKEEYRGKKIYQTLHTHLNKIAKQLNRKHIIATVHADNKHMLDTISCLDNYKVVCHMIHRKVPD